MSTTRLSTMYNNTHQTIDCTVRRITGLLFRLTAVSISWGVFRGVFRGRGRRSCGRVIIIFNDFTFDFGKSVHGERFKVKLTREFEVVVEFDRAIPASRKRFDYLKGF